MSSETVLTVLGFAATNPRHIVTRNDMKMATFRLASTPRRYDRVNAVWIDGTTQWYTVKCFRETADHVALSIHKGDPIVVRGRLTVCEWKTEDGVARMGLEIDALAIGHDLSYGFGSFRRSSRQSDGTSISDGSKIDDSKNLEKNRGVSATV